MSVTCGVMMRFLSLLTLTLVPWTACASADAPTDAPTDAGSDAQTEADSPTSALPTAASPALASGVVNVVMTVAGVNHTQLVANNALRQSFVDGIKAQVASATNVNVSDIEVSLSSGSVVASVTMKTDDVDKVNGSLNANMNVLKQSVVSTVSQLGGIDDITYGIIAVAQVSTSVVRDTAAPTSQPTASPTSLDTSTAAPNQTSSTLARSNQTASTTKLRGSGTSETSFASPIQQCAAVSVAVLVTAAMYA